MDTNTAEQNLNTRRSRTYRSRHRRIDYTPSDRAVEIVDKYIACNPRASIKTILDFLIVRAVAGNKSAEAR